MPKSKLSAAISAQVDLARFVAPDYLERNIRSGTLDLSLIRSLYLTEEYRLLCQFFQNISRLAGLIKDKATFETVFSYMWLSNTEANEAYFSCALTLVSAQPLLAPVLLAATLSEVTRLTISEAERRGALHVHSTMRLLMLRAVVARFPTLLDQVPARLARMMPYEHDPYPVHALALALLHECPAYVPAVAHSAVRVLLEHLVRLDLQLSALGDADEESCNERSTEGADARDEAHPPSIHCESMRSASLNPEAQGPFSQSFNASGGSPPASPTYTLSASVMDELMEATLTWISKITKTHEIVSRGPPEQPRSPTAAELLTPPPPLAVAPAELMDVLLPAFEATLLVTHRTRFPQFVLFYAASASAEAAEQFILRLLCTALHESTPPSRAISAACYIGSFLARAAFISPDLFLAAADSLISWQVGYAASAGARGPSVSHCVFYAVNHATLYSLAYWAMRLGRATVVALLNNHPFIDVLLSPLVPLRAALPSVSKQFIRMCRFFRPFGADTRLVLETPLSPLNVHVTADVATDDGALLADVRRQAIEISFPFDPYTLPRSCHFIEPLFQEWLNPSWRDEGQYDFIPSYFSL